MFDGFRTPASTVLGGEAGVGQGFKYFMSGIEVGRSTSPRAGPASRRRRSTTRPLRREREAFGKPIAHHQAVQLMVAKMATRAEAARLLTLQAAQEKARGERADLEAGMAKYFATEAAQENALDCMRIHGGYGYSLEYRPERYYRDAPLLLIGEGSNEIQQLIIARRLLERTRALTGLLDAGELAEIRAAVRELCARFPGEYWRALEPDRYPEEFVAALTERRLARRARPGGVRRRGARRSRRRA